jgi:putative ABC transport system permease protein
LNFGESIRLAIRGLTVNKLRSALTMLGIVIGVGAVITLLSVGQGVDRYVKEQFMSIGSNLLFVIPGSLQETSTGMGRTTRSAALTLSDARALTDPSRAPDVLRVAAEVSRYATVSAGKRDTYIQVQGVTPEYQLVRSWEPSVGSFISETDVAGNARVAVIGQSTVDRLFPDNPLPLGETIKINKVPFRVVGIMEKKGGSSFGDQDSVVFIPLTTAQTRLFPSKTLSGEYKISVIYAQASAENRMTAASDQISEILRERHKITFKDDDDFSVINQTDILNIFGQITGVLTIFLGAIAAISLLVGGIGIMNIMLVSVTERTREIGLRKAVGAKRRDILAQFLIEAVVLALVGGFIGIALGALGAFGIGQLASDLKTYISAQAVLIATGFSAAVGLFFGIYPASRAARLNPIEALRYE